MGVLRYIAKRLALYFAVLLIGLTITFLLPRFMPANPIEAYIGQMQARSNGTLTGEAIAEMRSNLRELYGMDGSLLTQYLGYMKRVVLEFDFGPSFAFYPQSVNEMLMNALPYTLGLLLISTFLGWVLGNLVGVVAGYFHTKKSATILEMVGILIYPIPYYILAVSMILLLAYIIPIFRCPRPSRSAV